MQYGMIYHGVKYAIWYDMIWYYAMWDDMIWYDMV